MPNVTSWVASINAVQAGVVRRGGKASAVVVHPPCGMFAVRALEAEINVRLPKSLATFLATESAGLLVDWSLPSESGIDSALREVGWGHVEFSLEDISSAERSRCDWVKGCFDNVADAYVRVWHHALGLMWVPNGDVIGFDLSTPSEDPPVIYLSHDDSSSHGRPLGLNFIDFMDRWTALGCPGTECWHMDPFRAPDLGLLDPNGVAAKTWRTWLGV